MARGALPLAWVLRAIGFFVFWADDSGFPNSRTFLRLSDGWLEYSAFEPHQRMRPSHKHSPAGSGGGQERQAKNCQRHCQSYRPFSEGHKLGC
jgi:hypothetical protein